MAHQNATYLTKAGPLLIAAIACLLIGGVVFTIGISDLIHCLGIFLMGLSAVLNLCALFSGMRALLNKKMFHWSLLVTVPATAATAWAAWVVIHL